MRCSTFEGRWLCQCQACGFIWFIYANTRTDGLALTLCFINLAALCPVMSLLLDLQLSVVLLSIFNIRFSQALIPASTIFCLACWALIFPSTGPSCSNSASLLLEPHTNPAKQCLDMCLEVSSMQFGDCQSISVWLGHQKAEKHWPCKLQPQAAPIEPCNAWLSLNSALCLCQHRVLQNKRTFTSWHSKESKIGKALKQGSAFAAARTPAWMRRTVETQTICT